ncbi:hypothetical protein BCR39DRAFT_559941 [Naematelia encephala]|uniref:Uncharacterized protein n=1 Tax=Naematelia encephala TaxID=71784 RepID=A0A1Y2AYK7_9TREE|nr:hypothetical protein BCR39DRAFT_559941 [Naematelia encephala]
MTANIDPFNAALCCENFHQPASSSTLPTFVAHFAPSSASSIPVAKVQEYSDGTFHNYYPLGISLFFSPSSEDKQQRLLDRIDIYNPPSNSPPLARRRGGANTPWAGYSPPRFPIVFTFNSTSLTIPPSKPDEPPRIIPRPGELLVDGRTKAKDFVAHFGEPTKKGGKLGWVPLFLEWASVGLKAPDGSAVKLGVMLELNDPGPEGMQALSDEVKKKGVGGIWDQAAEWEWADLKLFPAQ